MNRFRPYPNRSCLEDLSAPVSHFAACRREHDFMFRQLAQTHRQELHVDPTIWERTTNVWAGSAARTRASLLQLAATFYGRCASVAAMVALVAGLHLLPMPIKPVAPADEQPATATIQNQNDSQQLASATTRQSAGNNTNTSTASSAAPAPIEATTPSTPANSAQSPNSIIPETAPKPSQPTPAPSPSEPPTETPPGDSNLISAEVLADEDPLVQVSLPGISVKLL